MIVVFKILLRHYQRKIPVESDSVDISGNFDSHQISRIVDCLQYIVDTLKSN